MKNKYIANLVKVFLLSCNPPARRFYGSLMLNRGGKLILRVPKNIETIIKTHSDFQEINDK